MKKVSQKLYLVKSLKNVDSCEVPDVVSFSKDAHAFPEFIIGK